MVINRTPTILWLPVLYVLVAACNAANPDPEAAAEADAPDEQRAENPIEVQVTAAKREAFPLRTLTTGALTAARQAEIRMKASGELTQLPIEEGQRVEKGALLAAVDEQALQLQLRQQQLQLDQAAVEKQDLLIANGGQANVDTSVSAEKLQQILTLSGYNQAEHGIRQAEYELSKAQVHAPFGGLVADLQMRLHQQVNAGDPICHLFDPASFEATFELLEKEAVRVRPGQTVKVRPLALPERTFTAKITTINPLVSEEGLVTLRADLQNTGRTPLLEGMNVEVILEQPIPDQIIVPKSAVVLRSGREVVFTYAAEEGLAKWQYVTIAHENDRAVAIAEGIEAGALVIYEGNLNLDHDARVLRK